MWTKEKDLMTLSECSTNNFAYYKDIRLKNYLILIEKYEYIPTYNVKLLSYNGTCCLNQFFKLYPFDCFNIVEELIVNYNAI